MLPFLEGSLRLVADGVLVRSIRTLRQARAMLQQSGIGENDTHLNEIRESLRQMEVEAERRGLNIPEVPSAAPHF